MMDCCDTKVLDSEYVGGNSKNDPEKRLYNHLTDKDCSTKTVWVLRNSNDGVLYGVFSSVERAKEYAVKEFNDCFPHNIGQIVEERINHGVLHFSIVNSKFSTDYNIEDFHIDWGV